LVSERLIRQKGLDARLYVERRFAKEEKNVYDATSEIVSLDWLTGPLENSKTSKRNPTKQKSRDKYFQRIKYIF
jgi:hypothetical protein